MNDRPGARKRVMHVIEAMHQGGAESLLIEHVRWSSSAFEPVVCALNRGGPALEAVRALGAEADVLRRPGERGFGARLGSIRRLAQRMREQRIEVVNGHNPTGALVATLAARLAGVRAVVRTEHSLHYPGRHSAVYPMLELLMTVLTRRVVCVCEAVRVSHSRRLPWAAGRFVTVANGISPAPPTRPRETVRAELGVPRDADVALTIGSLTWQKAQDVLLQAFVEVVRERPAAQLWIAGDGPLRFRLEADCDALGLRSHVRFLGARGDTADLIAAADVFVLSSVREGLPVTLLEAGRAGCPAVVTAIGGCPEVVADGDSGRVVPVRDSAALGRALVEVLADPARARAMAEAARARWAARYTGEAMVKATEQVYRDALGEAPGATARERAEASDDGPRAATA